MYKFCLKKYYFDVIYVGAYLNFFALATSFYNHVIPSGFGGLWFWFFQ